MKKKIVKSSSVSIRVVLLTKSIDGGTGTFVESLENLDSGTLNTQFKIKTLVLEKPQFRQIKWNNVKYFSGYGSYPTKYSFNLLQIINFFREIIWLRKNIVKYYPQIILSVDLHSNLLAILNKILSKNSYKVVATTHIDLMNTLLDKSTFFLKNILKLLVKIIYTNADLLIGVSKGVSVALKNDFNIKKKIVTIYNGIKIKKKYCIQRNRIDNFVILTVMRLDEQKDAENLIEAFYLVQKQIPQSRLWILGDGPTRTKLEILVERYGLKGRVVFFGWVSNIKIGNFFRKSSLFVLSSKREGFPYALIEAMGYGLPTVSTNTPYGPSEILNDGKYGLLVPMKNPSKMSKKICKLLLNKNEYVRYSKYSVERAKHLSLDSMINKYSHIFKRLSR